MIIVNLTNLKAQKQTLVDMIEGDDTPLSGDELENVQGLINTLDDVQSALEDISYCAFKAINNPDKWGEYV